MNGSSILKSALVAITHLSLLAVIVGGTYFEAISLDVEVLVVLLAAEVLIVFQHRISSVRAGPIEIDLGEGGVDVDLSPENETLSPSDSGRDSNTDPEGNGGGTDDG